MNAKQKRYSLRYWKYTQEVYESAWDVRRCEWLEKNFGRKNKGRRYTWGGYGPTYYQFHKEKDYVAYILKWGNGEA